MAKGWPKLMIGKVYPLELYEQLALLRYERIKLEGAPTPCWGSHYQPSLPKAPSDARPIPLDGNWSDRPRCERCGQPVYCHPEAPQSQLCESCYWDLQDGKLVNSTPMACTNDADPRPEKSSTASDPF
jgi:hypothetical protein